MHAFQPGTKHITPVVSLMMLCRPAKQVSTYLLIRGHVIFMCEGGAEVEGELVLDHGGREAVLPRQLILGRKILEIVFGLADGGFAVERLAVVLCGDGKCGNEREEDDACEGVSRERSHAKSRSSKETSRVESEAKGKRVGERRLRGRTAGSSGSGRQ